jgi:hypothetical protein
VINRVQKTAGGGEQFTSFNGGVDTFSAYSGAIDSNLASTDRRALRLNAYYEELGQPPRFLRRASATPSTPRSPPCSPSERG